jgi:hypothetical protein
MPSYLKTFFEKKLRRKAWTSHIALNFGSSLKEEKGSFLTI